MIRKHSDFRDLPSRFPVIDDNGVVGVSPKRYRLRDHVLDARGHLIPDDRPVAMAVAFAPDVSPDDQFRNLLEAAELKIISKLRAAGMLPSDLTGDFEDDDDFIDDVDPQDSRYQSIHELVHDDVVGKPVPRAVAGLFKRGGAKGKGKDDSPRLSSSEKASASDEPLKGTSADAPAQIGHNGPPEE